MNPISLHLKGFEGIRAGLGLDEISIDFSALPPGLIPLIGENGAGKTTTMDNMQPFRLMPSKLRDSKNWSPDAFSYYNECYGPDACKEFVFEFGGKTFKEKILIDADRRKQECYLYEQQEGLWQPLNDGKTATYDEAIEKVVGSPTLFFTSIFQAQDARRLTSYTRSSIMSIISELLCNDYIKVQGDKAKKVADALKGHLAPIINQLAAMMDEINASARFQEMVKTGKETIRNVQTASQERKDSLGKTQATILEKGKQQAAQDSEKRRLQDLEAVQLQDQTALSAIDNDIAARNQKHNDDLFTINRRFDVDIVDTETELAQVTAEKAGKVDAYKTATAARHQKHNDDLAAINQRFDVDIVDTETELAQVTTEKAGKVDAYKSTVETLNSAIERAQKLTANIDGIRAKIEEETTATASLAGLKSALQTKEDELQKSQAESTKLSQLQTDIANVRMKKKTAESKIAMEVERIETAITHAENAASKLSSANCKLDTSQPDFEPCDFMADAVSAKNSLPELREKLVAAKEPSAEIVQIDIHIANMEQQISLFTDVPERLQLCAMTVHEIRGKIREIEASLTEIAKWTRLLPEAEQAGRNIEQYQAELIDKEGEYNQVTDGLNNRLASLQVKIERLEHDKAEQSERNIEQHQAELTTKEGEYNQAIDALNNKLSVLQTKIVRLENDKSGQVSALQNDLTTDLYALSLKQDEVAARIKARDMDLLILRESLTTDIASVIETLQQTVTGIEQEIVSFENQLRQLQAECSINEEKLQTIEAKKIEAAALQTKIDRFNVEIAHFMLLAKACSNDGIIALELDDAAPGISALTNDLLTACYGPRFAIRLETQRLKNDGTLTEDFDISVFDSETDKTSSFFDKCGGERTWLEDAIRRAFGLYNTYNSQKNYDARFSDETEGALSPLKKLEFMAIKRRAMELGNYGREFFISHTPECQDMADGRLVFEKGKGVTALAA